MSAQQKAERWHWAAWVLLGIAFLWETVGLVGHYRLRREYVETRRSA